MVECETKRELSLQTRVNGGVRVIFKSVKAVTLVVSVNLLIKTSLNFKSADSILKLDTRLYTQSRLNIFIHLMKLLYEEKMWSPTITLL